MYKYLKGKEKTKKPVSSLWVGFSWEDIIQKSLNGGAQENVLSRLLQVYLTSVTDHDKHLSSLKTKTIQTCKQTISLFIKANYFLQRKMIRTVKDGAVCENNFAKTGNCKRLPMNCESTACKPGE